MTENEEVRLAEKVYAQSLFETGRKSLFQDVIIERAIDRFIKAGGNIGTIHKLDKYVKEEMKKEQLVYSWFD